jgi:UDP-N-acetylglucosamine 4,6-dehydratase
MVENCSGKDFRFIEKILLKSKGIGTLTNKQMACERNLPHKKREFFVFYSPSKKLLKSTMFNNEVLLITGGTGSFGNAVLRRFLNSTLREIRIFSRDEKKQDDMRKLYNNSKVKFYIGDVRDAGSVTSAMRGTDYVFHAAALKQVPSCEFYPLQAVRTNILGTENVLEEAIKEGVKRVICLSTDKAVYPINAMGISKAMMEKVAIAKSRESNRTVICVTRYGNVMASRGSVIPLFVNQILNKQVISVTDPNMTRFMMTLDNAVDLVLYAFKNGNSGDTFVQKSPAATIDVLTQALKKLLKVADHPVRIIGTRHGEKLHEVLLSREEMARSEDLGDYYRILPDLRDLNFGKYFEVGEQKISVSSDYNSYNTTRLDVEGMIQLLIKLRSIQAIMRGEPTLYDE